MTATKTTIKKRDGTTEELDLEKMHKVVFYACEDITGVSASEVEIKSHLQFYDGIESADIQETLIKAAADLISEETPNYQWVAGRLINYHLRKQVYDKFEPPHLREIARKNVDRGLYVPEFFSVYSDEEIDEMQDFIKHDRDEDMTYAAMEQFRGKYLVQNHPRNRQPRALARHIRRSVHGLAVQLVRSAPTTQVTVRPTQRRQQGRLPRLMWPQNHHPDFLHSKHPLRS